MTELEKPLTYSYRPRPLGDGYEFRLTPHTLDWNLGMRSGQIAYPMIRHVRLGFKPTNMAGSRYLAEIWPVNAPKLVLYSTSMQSLINTADQGEEYSAFLRELHRRMAAAGAKCVYQAGFSAWRWWLALVVAVATFFAVLYVIVRGFVAGEYLVSALIAFVGAWFLWQVSNIVLRNRPRIYTPDNIPREVLPN
ncbi:MAG: hypothetical protein KF794_09810 [Xanthobacteraceae bacterium]|nr:hypothetical protein [Xanthobacteraceae bacterium]QYK44088.1 MAG: hypothetical protein KF794_09810 [Xanthobacteraceae bacterium]HMN50721.1 hypothetical protein [Xanthobacteraceae bacterium]